MLMLYSIKLHENKTLAKAFKPYSYMRSSLNKSSLDHLHFVTCFNEQIFVKRCLHKSPSGHTYLGLTPNNVILNVWL